MNQSRSDRQEAICEAPKMTDQGGQSGQGGQDYYDADYTVVDDDNNK